MTQLPARTHRDPDVRRAWWSFALFLPSLIGAFVTGEGLIAASGYGAKDTVPVGDALLAGTPAMLVFALPLLVVRHFGRRAVRHGDPDGRLPQVLALAVVACFVASNLLQLGARLVL